MIFLRVLAVFLFSSFQPLIAVDAWDDKDILSRYCPDGKEDRILYMYWSSQLVVVVVSVVFRRTFSADLVQVDW